MTPQMRQRVVMHICPRVKPVSKVTPTGLVWCIDGLAKYGLNSGWWADEETAWDYAYRNLEMFNTASVMEALKQLRSVELFVGWEPIRIFLNGFVMDDVMEAFDAN